MEVDHQVPDSVNTVNNCLHDTQVSFYDWWRKVDP